MVIVEGANDDALGTGKKFGGVEALFDITVEIVHRARPIQTKPAPIIVGPLDRACRRNAAAIEPEIGR